VTVAQTYGYPSAVKGVLPPENLPIQRAWAEWIQKHVGFHKLTDQGLPQDVVAGYFEAQDSLILGAITPEEAGEQVQEAIIRFKKRSN
jgi:raffinose/stachyose/melibiose transport system substrate-binding protein